MKTGARFWQLIGLVFLILVGYALAELHDAVEAKEKALQDQQQLLYKQEALTGDHQWDANLAAVAKLRQQWLAYLPVESSPAVAKAHLLGELRSAAINAGITNATVNAADAESGDRSSSSYSAGRPSQSATKANALATGVHMVKADISGRFDPAAFNTLMRSLEERRFTVIDRVSIRGTQVNLNVRCYWYFDSSAGKPGAVKGDALPVKTQS